MDTGLSVDATSGNVEENISGTLYRIFPSYPVPFLRTFRILPERAEILKGLLGADFIAFHTHDYMRHFISAVERVLHLDFKLDEVQINNRVTRVEALPMESTMNLIIRPRKIKKCTKLLNVPGNFSASIN